MAQYDNTNVPDENNNFYVDAFGERLQDDEALPERGEMPADLAGDEDQITFYEQSPDDFLDEAYTPDPAGLSGDEPYRSTSLDDHDLSVFEEDQGP